MRTKTVFIIIFTVIITIFLMINTDAVEFNFIVVKANISKLVVVGVCTFVGFILGFIVRRPKTTISTYDKDYDDHRPVISKSTLSDEDRDYINP